MPTDPPSSANSGSQPTGSRQQSLPHPPFRYAPSPQHQIPTYPITAAVPMLSRPPPPNPQAAQTYYPPSAFQAPMPSFSSAVQQPYPINSYVYQPPQYPYPPMPSPPQQSMLNAREQPAYRNAQMQPQPQPQVILPTPHKKSILKIVDPDTNQEVKIDQKLPSPAPPVVEPARLAVQIPQRESRALELVSDPADVQKHPRTPISDSQNTQKTLNPPVNRDPAPPQISQSAVAPEAESLELKIISVTKPTVPHSSYSAATSPGIQQKPTSTPDAKELYKVPTQAIRSNEPNAPIGLSKPAQIEKMTSAVSSNTLLEAQQENNKEITHKLPQTLSDSLQAVGPTSSSDSTTARALQTKSPLPVVTEQAPPSDQHVEPPASPVTSSEAKPDPTESPPAMDVPPSSDADRKVSPGSDQPERADSRSSSSKEDLSGADSPPQRSRHNFLVNDRLVYPPAFMWAVRPTVPPRKTSEYDSVIRSAERGLFKGDPTSSAHSDPRTQIGRKIAPLSSDPRGSRTYPIPGSTPFSIPSSGQHGPGATARSFPEFDLNIARSQAPPPPRGQAATTTARDGDPRGSRQQASRSRYDHSRHSTSDPFINISRAPVEKLKRSDKGWKRDKEAEDGMTANLKRIRALLNKLTIEKFDKIFAQIVSTEMSSFEMVDGVVKEIFEKTLFEPEFSAMYAELCRRLELHLSEPLKRANVLDLEGKPISFRKILLNNCRDEFTRFASSAEGKESQGESTSENAEKSTEKKTEKDLSSQEKEETALKAIKAKRRTLANVRFIGELYLKNLLRDQVIHQFCIRRLLTIGIESREEDVLEALCKLVSKTGAKISANAQAEGVINDYFNRFQTLSKDHTLPARIRFMIQDLIEQRHNKWKVRREKSGAKTIAEIHKQAKEEERKKHEAQNAARDRRGRGGMGSRDRPPQGFGSRMTMASGVRQGGSLSQSRVDKLLERQPTRSPAGSQFSSVSLRPSSSSLRPGSRFGSFGLLQEKETSLNGPGSDVRRAKSGSWQQPPARRSFSKPADPKPDVIDRKSLKRKAKGCLEEYCVNSSLSEVREILEEEVKEVNYQTFLEEAMMVTFSSQASHVQRSIDLFSELVEQPISAEHFCSAFSKYVGTLSDIEIDNPRCGEYLGKIMGATAATSKLDLKDKEFFGLGFLDPALQKIEDPKRKANVIIFTLSELFRRLANSVKSETERADIVRRVADRLHVDLAADMSAWNPIRGLDKLSDMLKDNSVSFLEPYLALEMRLKDVLSNSISMEGVESVISSAKPNNDAKLLAMVVRVGFEALFMASPANVFELFKQNIAAPLLKCFQSPSREIQFALLLSVQVFVGRNSEIFPPLRDDSKKHGEVILNGLYNCGLVEKATLLQWRDEKSETEIVSFKKVLVEQTQHFFKLL